MYDAPGDQADRQKMVTLVSRAASQNGTGQAAVEAEDGEAIPTDDPKAFTQLRLGGIDQNSYGFFMGVMQLRETIVVPMITASTTRPAIG